ncbi:DUF3667 domain-containing protein [Spongiimicrobium salis]|uniref:DUF3667 domain-containing protein n=1 Tax=Spongiimicrobium salis TaxID=1667022 RepID=UPI00374D6336
MYCKNCDTPLRFRANFCYACGAKIIRNRLTIKNLWADFSERFLNVENYLVKTFRDMFAKPDAVISGYVSGIRKRYINPAGYLTFALTLAGFLFFIQNKFFDSIYTDAFSVFESNNSNVSFQATESINEAVQNILEYQSLILILTVPILAIISRIVFYNYKKFNFSEHVVLNIYTYSHYTITISLLQFLTLWNSNLFLGIALSTTLLQFIYYIYVLQQVFDLNAAQVLLKILLFFAVSFVLYILVSIVSFAFVFLFTDAIEEIIKEVEKNKKVAQLPMTLYHWIS